MAAKGGLDQRREDCQGGGGKEGEDGPSGKAGLV